MYSSLGAVASVLVLVPFLLRLPVVRLGVVMFSLARPKHS